MKENIPINSELVAIIPKAVHNISQADISDNALKVISRLKQAKYEAYLVGGAVRDLILGRHPKDFDIATNALPEQVHELFRNSRLIGRRFRLVHVRFGREIIEVATFRGDHDATADTDSEDDGHVLDGMIIRDNVYGTLKDDAWRRDFSVNALYYEIHEEVVLDYTDGYKDIEQRIIRIIGDAERRYREDPVRMLRVVRFAAKLGFKIEEHTQAPLIALAPRLSAVPPARLFEEVLKLFLSGHAVKTFELLRLYGLFEYLFPLTDANLDASDVVFQNLLINGFGHTDARIEIGKPVTPAYLFAILLWKPTWDYAQRLMGDGMGAVQALQVAGMQTISRQAGNVSLPKRFSLQTREIWSMQAKLLNRNGRRALRLIEHARFRAGYDFLLLRAESGEHDLVPLGEWWTQFQEKNDSERITMVAQISSKSPRKRHHRKRKQSST